MSRFKVGQKVLLMSLLFPESNGEYEVTDIHPAIEGQLSERTGQPDHDTTYTLQGLEGYWSERALSEV